MFEQDAQASDTKQYKYSEGKLELQKTSKHK